MKRRRFFQQSTLAAIATAVSSKLAFGAQRPRRILLRSSWQTVNIGLDDWLFNFDDEEDVKRLPGAVLAMAKEPAAAKAKAATAKRYVEQRQQATMAILKRVTS